MKAMILKSEDLPVMGTIWPRGLGQYGMKRVSAFCAMRYASCFVLKTSAIGGSFFALRSSDIHLT